MRKNREGDSFCSTNILFGVGSAVLPYKFQCGDGFRSGKQRCGVGIVVSDTTPLISLFKIKRVDLLKELFGDVLVPQAVFDEFDS